MGWIIRQQLEVNVRSKYNSENGMQIQFKQAEAHRQSVTVGDTHTQ